MLLLSPPLQAFLSVVKYKTVHLASQHLHLTQTAVTQRIQALESKLGISLFVRSRRGMTLTKEGEALLRYCQTATELEGETLAKIQRSGIESTVHIGVTGPTSIMQARIIPLCLDVLKSFPNLIVTFNINDAETRGRALQTAESDLAIMKPEDISGEMEQKILRPEHYVLVCTSKWKKRHLSEILTSERIIDYDPLDQMTFQYLKHFNLFEHIRSERHFVNRTESLAKMLIAGLGFGVLTKEFSEPYIQNKELIVLNNGKIYQNQLALAWYTRPNPPLYLSKLIESIN